MEGTDCAGWQLIWYLATADLREALASMLAECGLVNRRLTRDSKGSKKVAGQTTCLLLWSGRLTYLILRELDTNVQKSATKDRYAASETALGSGGP